MAGIPVAAVEGQIDKLQPVRVNELQPSQLRTYLTLDGEWGFELDPEKAGEEDGWHKAAHRFGDTIVVPGCLEAQQKGLTYQPIGRPKWGGTYDMPYLGTSWHQRTVKVPESFENKTIHLNFGGVATNCKVWMNGQLLGEHHLASIPFGFDVTDVVRLGEENVVTVMVENRHHYRHFKPRNNHGFGSTTLEMRWSGVYRDVELVAMEDVYIDDVYLIPNAETGEITCEYSIHSGDELDGYRIETSIVPWAGTEAVASSVHTVTSRKGSFTLAIPGARKWSDTDPFLYRLTCVLKRGDAAIDDVTERFGLRDIRFDGNDILLNEAPVFLRGDMVHYHWPLTISPTTDRDDLREKLARYKDYGFNFLRHHTHFPSTEYLEVCDELGLLSHNESSVLSNLWPIFDDDRERLWEFLLKRDRNHPSVIIWCFGNESHPTHEDISTFAQATFAIDKTRLLQTNSPGHFVSLDGSTRLAPVYHEFRMQGASYVDTRIKDKYVGALRPWRMMWAQERTQANGIDRYLNDFVENTQVLQALCFKLLIEGLRLEGTDKGYELGTFRDSGSFMWGVVDDHFGEKILTPAEFRRFNEETVLLWRRDWQKRIYDASFHMAPSFSMACSHYGPTPIDNAVLRVTVVNDSGEVLAEYTQPDIHIPVCTVRNLATFRSVDSFLKPLTEPSKLKLKAELTAEGFRQENSWDFWAFPSEYLKESSTDVYVSGRYELRDFVKRVGWRKRYPFIKDYQATIPPSALLISSELDERVMNHLAGGGRVLLAGFDNFDGRVTEWGAGRSEYPRGTSIRDHPLTDRFPHDGWCDIPFAGMMNSSVPLNGIRNERHVAIDLRKWPEEIEPIIMNFPSYRAPNPSLLSHLMEMNVGQGRLMITTLRFDMVHEPGFKERNRNYATEYFFDQMLRYLISDEFEPTANISEAFLRKHVGRKSLIPVKGPSW